MSTKTHDFVRAAWTAWADREGGCCATVPRSHRTRHAPSGIGVAHRKVAPIPHLAISNGDSA
jgi:hypothetical protein